MFLSGAFVKYYTAMTEDTELENNQHAIDLIRLPSPLSPLSNSKESFSALHPNIYKSGESA